MGQPKKCPNCKILNPAEAMICDCGCNFDAGRMEAAASVRLEADIRQSQRTAAKLPTQGTAKPCFRVWNEGPNRLLLTETHSYLGEHAIVHGVIHGVRHSY
jgi:hypothetical protein